MILIMLAVLGAAMGSFAGATAWRLKKGRDFVTDRSECESCHHKLNALDLFPVFSWLALRGRCRYCRKPIGISLLATELVMAVIFALSYVYWPFPLSNFFEVSQFILWLTVCSGMAILFLYDLKWYLLPDKVVFPLIGVSLVYFALLSIGNDWSLERAIAEGLLCLLPVTGLYGFLYYISKGKWVGFGDVKLGIVMGLVLGWQGALVAVLVANFVGVVFVAPLLFARKKKRQSVVPFGPFLIMGFLVAGLFSQELITGYITLLLT